MMTRNQQLIEKYRGAALRFWFEPESSYEMEVERVLCGLHSARHFDSDWEPTPYRYDPRNNTEYTDRFVRDVYEASTYF